MICCSYGEDPSQFVRLHLPRETVPTYCTTFILVHGGYWKNKYGVDNAAMSSLPLALTKRLYAVVEVEYRRRDDDGGGWPGTCDDMCSALSFIKSQQHVAGWSRVDLSRLVLLGHSAGGHGALVLAHRAAAASSSLPVPMLTVADLVAGFERRLSDEGNAVERFLGFPPDTEERLEAYRAASPIHSMLPLATTTLIVTGTHDVDVPVDLTLAFVDAAASAAAEQNLNSEVRLRFLKVLGADHYDLLDGSSLYWRTLLTAIEAHVDAILRP